MLTCRRCSNKDLALLKLLCALLVIPVIADAGVLYEVEVRPLDQTNMALASPGAPPAAPVVTRYFSDEGEVRVGGPNAKMVYCSRTASCYAIDNSSRAVHRAEARHIEPGLRPLHLCGQTAGGGGCGCAGRPTRRSRAQGSRYEGGERSLLQPVPRDYRLNHTLRVGRWACLPNLGRTRKRSQAFGTLRRAAGFGAGRRRHRERYENSQSVSPRFQFCLRSGLRAFGMVAGHRPPRGYSTAHSRIQVRQRRFRSLADWQSGKVYRERRCWILPDGYQVQDGPDYAQWYMR